MKSAHGILKALQFLEEVLLSARNSTTTITAAPSTSHIVGGGDVSNLVAIKHSLFRRQADSFEVRAETPSPSETETTTLSYEDEEADEEVNTDLPLEKEEIPEVEFG